MWVGSRGHIEFPKTPNTAWILGLDHADKPLRQMFPTSRIFPPHTVSTTEWGPPQLCVPMAKHTR